MRIIIIGAGPGGYETALLAAQRGLEVTLVERDKAGGTCLNAGCIPTKSLCRSAEILENVRNAAGCGISVPQYGFDFKSVMERKDAVVSTLEAGVMTLLGHPGIDYVRGRASFKDSHTVSVQSADGRVSEYTGDIIIIATGSVPASPDIPGADLPGVVFSSGLLESDVVPERLCIIGAGVIGLEFASIFSSFGSKVTIVEYCREILPRFDQDIAKRLRQSLSKRGIDFRMGAQVSRIASSGGHQSGALSVVFSRKGIEEQVEADTVLMAVGRRPSLHTLNLDDIGVGYTSKGISVNAFMQTSVPHVYAIGDITGGVMLAHAAVMQGVKALDHIMGLEDRTDLSVMPAAVFTMPEAASVGLTEEECKAAGIDVTCRKAFFRANGKAMCMGETDGMCKLLTDSAGRIVGCHIYGPHSSDLIHEIAAFMTMKASVDDIRRMVHVHPSLNEIFRAL